MIFRAALANGYNLRDSAAHPLPAVRRTCGSQARKERTLEELVRLAAQPIAYIGCTVIFLGILYLGMNLRDGARAGGGELRKAIAMIAAGAAVTGFAAIYGFTGF